MSIIYSRLTRANHAPIIPTSVRFAGQFQGKDHTMTREYDLIVKGGSVVLPDTGIIKSDIGVRGEKIAALGADLPSQGARVIDAGGKYVLAGLIDPHVHIGNNMPLKQDLLMESRGAAAGGVTTLISTLRIVSDPTIGGGERQKERIFETYEQYFPKIQKLLEGPCTHIDYTWHFCPLTFADAQKADQYYEEFGVQSYKFYLAYTRRMYSPGINSGQLYEILRMWTKLRHHPLAMLHCEADEIVEVTTEEVRKAGLTGLAAWNAARPNIAEELAIRTACLLAGRTGARLYIVHVSTGEGAEAVAEAQHKGIDIIGETCPHYLSLTEDSPNLFGKVQPPIRKQVDVETLWSGIQRNVITCIGTDHVTKPNLAVTDDIWKDTGTRGMETRLPVMITEATNRGIPLTKVAEICSLNNARTFGLLPKKGTIAIGSDADLVIVDLNKKKTVLAKDLWTGSGHSPFEGMELIGWPVLTMLRGQVIFQDDQIVGEPTGKFVPIYPKAG